MPFTSIWDLEEAVKTMRSAIDRWEKPLKEMLEGNNIPHEELESMKGVYLFKNTDVSQELMSELQKVIGANNEKIEKLYDLFGVIEDTRSNKD